MKKLLPVVITAFLFSCNDNSKVENELNSIGNKIDTLAKKVDDSEVVDSIKSKGERLVDSSKSKGGRLIKSLDNKLKGIKAKRDTTE
jgi:hypothetical protein